jgi:hypothetical protein
MTSAEIKVDVSYGLPTFAVALKTLGMLTDLNAWIVRSFSLPARCFEHPENKEPPMNERRVKIFTVDENLVIDILNGLPHECIILPISEEIPAGAVVEQFWHDPGIRGFCMAVLHPSYQLVPPGQEPEKGRHLGRVEFFRVPLALLSHDGRVHVRDAEMGGTHGLAMPLAEWRGKTLPKDFQNGTRQYVAPVDCRPVGPSVGLDILPLAIFSVWTPVENLVDEIDHNDAAVAGGGAMVYEAFASGAHAYMVLCGRYVEIKNCSGETIPEGSRIVLEIGAKTGFARTPDGRRLAVEIVQEGVDAELASAAQDSGPRDGGPVDSTPGQTWRERPSML